MLAMPLPNADDDGKNLPQSLTVPLPRRENVDPANVTAVLVRAYFLRFLKTEERLLPLSFSFLFHHVPIK